ncbi:plasmid mobilization protein [Microcoleus sp. AT9b-C3]|uniref:plasmid mobilization protein n=1 Tax=Microcoleus sp. AT9b-C3 TaxID=2818629 RepID=UPI002FD4F02C
MLTTATLPKNQLSKPNGKTEVVRVRLTTLEKADLVKRAAESGEKSLSDYLRKRAFSLDRTVPAIDEATCAQLRKMSAHICQMTRGVETAVKAGKLPKQSLELLQKFSRMLGEYHQELRGKVRRELLSETCEQIPPLVDYQ